MPTMLLAVGSSAATQPKLQKSKLIRTVCYCKNVCIILYLYTAYTTRKNIPTCEMRLCLSDISSQSIYMQIHAHVLEP